MDLVSHNIYDLVLYLFLCISHSIISDILFLAIFYYDIMKRADALIQYLKATSAETPYLIRESEEITLTHEQEVTFINSSITSERSVMLIATIDGKHIGNCSLQSLGNFKRYAHRCDIAIALYQEYCGYGILRRHL